MALEELGQLVARSLSEIAPTRRELLAAMPSLSSYVFLDTSPDSVMCLSGEFLLEYFVGRHALQGGVCLLPSAEARRRIGREPFGRGIVFTTLI